MKDFRTYNANDNTRRKDRLETLTPSEQLTIELLLKSLKQYPKIQLEILANTYLFFSKRKTIKYLNSIAVTDLEEVVKRHSDIYAKRPDLFIPRLGLSIEVNGSVHDRIDQKQANDIFKEYSFASLGVRTYVIENEMLWDVETRQKAISDLVTLIKQLYADPKVKKQYKANKTQLHRCKQRYLNNQKDTIQYFEVTKKDLSYTKPFGCFRSNLTDAQVKNCGVAFSVNLKNFYKKIRKQLTTK